MNFLSKGAIALMGCLFFLISFGYAGKTTFRFAPFDGSSSSARGLIPHADFEPHAVRSTGCLGCLPCGLFNWGTDKRERVVDSSVFPYSIHACVRAQFEEGRTRASATLISPHSFVTTAHAVLKDKESATVLTFQFELETRKKAGFLWRKTETRAGTTIRTSNPHISIHTDYLEHGDKSPYDIAVITLDETAIVNRQGRQFTYGTEPFETGEPYYGVGEHYGYAGLGSYEPQSLVGSPIAITGYPARVRCSGWTFNSYTMAGPVKGHEGPMIFHKIDTSPGQSGAASTRSTPDGGVEAVAIHLGEGKRRFRRFNRALVFDRSVMQFLSRHLEQHEPEWWQTSGLDSITSPEVSAQGGNSLSDLTLPTVAAVSEEGRPLLESPTCDRPSS